MACHKISIHFKSFLCCYYVIESAKASCHSHGTICIGYYPLKSPLNSYIVSPKASFRTTKKAQINSIKERAKYKMHFSNCIRVGSLYRSLRGKNRRGKKSPEIKLGYEAK